MFFTFLQFKKAIKFGREAHKGQFRKYSNKPYHTHTEAVARIVGLFTHNKDIVNAAILHDVAEDTNFQIIDIVQNFGANVGIYVNELTDKYTLNNFPELNRKNRKQLEAQRLNTISKNSKLIKLADLIHNTHDIFLHDRNFAAVYLKEKEYLLNFLKEGNYFLYLFAKWQVKILQKLI